MIKRILLIFFAVSAITASAYDSNRGFKHPGGLHTEADFDRIKQQLADKDSVTCAAYEVLCNATYAQPSTATYPVVTIVRGGGSGENYMNAARGAAIAYQNALRWKIGGNEDCAKHAVDVLMAWARTTTGIGGNSNYALAAGIYGYEFAQAAELVRDYQGWSADDFATFQQWMLDVWYPSCIGFLRTRNGTWENASKWWRCPGHYWSNWGLCNVLCVISIGILCDDVYIYNQGMSFFKYDQVGTFQDPRTADPILNDGLTEFLGNLVVTTTESDLETGAYGKIGQMQESGRDIGHCTMALGLAVDIAHIGYNQGDDLFSYMDHRLAAGAEYVAAQCLSVDNLPWTNYKYATNGIYWTDSRSWLMTAPALGSQLRPYWGTIIGHYEGVKGVEMPFAHRVYDQMGIDGGGGGSTSGGYDHLGYSVLMNARPKATSATVPTSLTPSITTPDGTLAHNELGGLTNTYTTNTNTGVASGTVLTLQALLPDGETDTGRWLWNSGETTATKTISATQSGVYRVTYTNQSGVQSEQMFSIAVQGDTHPSTLTPYINGVNTATSTILLGDTVTLNIGAAGSYGTFLWNNGSKASQITINGVSASTTYSVTFTNQGGATSTQDFSLTVLRSKAQATVDGTVNSVLGDTLNLDIEEGADVVLTPCIAKSITGGTYLWNDGATTSTLSLSDIRTSAAGTYTCIYTPKTGNVCKFVYIVSVNPGETIHNVTSYLLNNADFNEGDAKDWRYSFSAYNNIGYQGASYTNGDVTISKFIECWRNKAYIGDGAISQSLSVLPQGSYTLEADGIASWQSDASAKVTGVNIFVGDNTVALSTANGAPEHITLDFTQEASVPSSIGLKTTSCNANWIAVDNFCITLNGSRYDFLQFRLNLLRHYISQIEANGVSGTAFMSVYERLATVPQGSTIKVIEAAGSEADDMITKVKSYLDIAWSAFQTMKLAKQVDEAEGDSICQGYAYSDLISYLDQMDITIEGVNEVLTNLKADIYEAFGTDLRSTATETHPIDVTPFIANPNIYQGGATTESPAGWTVARGNADGSGVTLNGACDTELFCYSWSGNASHSVGNRVFSQCITGLPRGKYVLKAATLASCWAARIYTSLDNTNSFTTADFNLDVNTYWNTLADSATTTKTAAIEVKKDTLYVGARGVYADYSGYISGNGRMWRADNFRLYYVGYLPEPGDMNGDGHFTVGDLTALVHLFNTSDLSALTADEQDLADVDKNGKLEPADITALADKIKIFFAKMSFIP